MFEKAIMREIINKLNAASEAYYNGREIMSNKEYDDLLAMLQDIESKSGIVLKDSPTRNVGAPVPDTLEKFTHPYPAKSLDKTKDIDQFVQKFKEGIAASGSNNDKVVLMYKEDGSTAQAYYNNHKLVRLVTRGDGQVGSVVTHNAKNIQGLPATIAHDGELVVRGEVLMSYGEFERVNQDFELAQKYKNPRNLASASLTMLDATGASKRQLQFKAFNLVHSYPELNEHTAAQFHAMLDLLDSNGFDTVERIVCSVDELKDAIQKMTKSVESYPFPVDGLVAALDNYEYAKTLEGTEHHPHIMQGYAFKWADNAKETVLREIEWSPSRTGLLNPVAIFDPIELEGTTVKRASLHNLSVMRNMRIHVGDKLSVFKSNMIIPYVDKNLSYDEETDYDDDFIHDQLIAFCPTCGAEVKIVTSKDGIETVYCSNEECPEKMVGKFAHFCSRHGLDIQGMSEETIKKLVSEGIVNSYEDFFKLHKHPEIATLPGFGQQSWENMCKSAEKARTTDFIHFFTALSIPDIGSGQLKILRNYMIENYATLAKKCGMSSDGNNLGVMLSRLGMMNFNFAQIDGFGDILANNLLDWLHTRFDLTNAKDSQEISAFDLVEFTDEIKTTQPSILSGKSLCITGKLHTFKNRQELVDKIESLGGKWVDSVSSKTDYLINNDKDSTSGKNKKAKELNIPIISEEDFLQLIN